MRRSGIAMACALVSMTIATGMAQAQGTGSAKATESGVTVYGGYRGSTQLTEATTGQNVYLNSSASYALAVDFGIDPNKQWEIFYSRQKTEMTSAGFSAAANNVPLTIQYLHFGGTYFSQGIGNGVYVAGGLGATLLEPDRAGLNSVAKASMSLSAGVLVPIGKNLGLRLEARGYATLLNNSGGMFCGSNTGCTVTVKGSALYQGEALVGLSARF